MTEQEMGAINQLRQEVQVIGRGLRRGMKRVERIERALLGDVPYGDMGLILEHQAMLTRLEDVETAVKSSSKAIQVINGIVENLPVIVAGMVIFYWTNGSDAIAILRFLMEVIR